MSVKKERAPIKWRVAAGALIASVVLSALLYGCGKEPESDVPALEGRDVFGEISLHTTEDWISFIPDDKAGNLAYTLSVPEGWTESGTVFNDGDEKVAEIVPPILLADGQELPESITGGDFDSEIISQGIKDIAGKDCLVRVTEAFSGTKEGTWYQYTYYIPSGKTVFIIAFFTYNADSKEDSKLFESIIKTITTERKN